jgi:hypothetical protein
MNTGATPNANRPESEELEDGEFKGLLVEKVSSANGASVVVALDARYCRDASRWEVMPSVDIFPELVRLDLHKSRYITVVHDSVTELQKLQHLGLTGCTRLQELPLTLGRLQNLQVVGTTVRTVVWNKLVTGLPEPPVGWSYHTIYFSWLTYFLCTLSLQLDLSDSDNITHLPESIGDLKR